MSGSYLLAEEGGPHNRTGGVSVSLSSPDGHVIGGSAGMLIAAGPVQVYSLGLSPFLLLVITRLIIVIQLSV